MAATKCDPAVSTDVAISPRPRLDLPFQWALGESIRALPPSVQDHVLQSPGTVVLYRGRMRVWRDGGWRGKIAGWLLRVGTLARFMFPETGEEVEFEIEHAVKSHDDGSLSMSWIRTYHFHQVKRRFDALMRFHPTYGPIVLWTGCLGCLQVELCPRVEDNAIVVVSRREWLGVGRFRIPIPGWLKGRPYVRESEEPDGALRIHVEIHNTLLGHFFGYEGRYRKVEATTP